MSAGALQVGFATAGSVEISALPLSSTATQSAAEGHETLVRIVLETVPSISSGALQVGLAAVGLVEIRTFRAVSTATAQ